MEIYLNEGWQTWKIVTYWNIDYIQGWRDNYLIRVRPNITKMEILMRNDKLGKWWLIGISTIYKGDDWTIQEYNLKMKETITLQVEFLLDG